MLASSNDVPHLELPAVHRPIRNHADFLGRIYPSLGNIELHLVSHAVIWLVPAIYDQNY